MMVVVRFRAPDGGAERLRADLDQVRTLFGQLPGHVDTRIGRSLDEPELWVLVSRWENVGSYRRALSSFQGKYHIAPVLGRAVDEPSAYEDAGPGAELNQAGSRSLG